MRVAFDIKYRKDIEAGRMQVVSESGQYAKITIWDSDFKQDHPIVATFNQDGDEYFVRYKADGTSDSSLFKETGRLFIIDK